jgi:hypothetical protein
MDTCSVRSPSSVNAHTLLTASGGIVTKYTLKTYPIGKVWGGYRIYSTNKRDQLYAGFHAFIKNPNPDPKAAIIFNTEHMYNNGGAFMVFFFYDGPVPPKGAFGPIFDVTSTIDLCSVRTYTDLVRQTQYSSTKNSLTLFPADL